MVLATSSPNFASKRSPPWPASRRSRLLCQDLLCTRALPIGLQVSCVVLKGWPGRPRCCRHRPCWGCVDRKWSLLGLLCFCAMFGLSRGPLGLWVPPEVIFDFCGLPQILHQDALPHGLPVSDLVCCAKICLYPSSPHRPASFMCCLFASPKSFPPFHPPSWAGQGTGRACRCR